MQWEQYFDDDNQPYWYSWATGESTYDNPTTDTAVSQQAAAAWTEYYDDDAGMAYW